MKRLAWLTDLHLDVLKEIGLFKRIEVVCDEIKANNIDAVLISGDISIAVHLSSHLDYLTDKLEKPIYFVLGNHDFYYRSIAEVKANLHKLTQHSPYLTWLTHAGVIELSPTVALIGCDGWADGRFGDYQNSNVHLADYDLINDFFGLDKHQRLSKLHELGDDAATHVRQMLPQAIDKYQRVIFLTHVPPFKEACWHEGRISNDNYLPHFACKAVGDVLREIMSKHPQKHLTVLCGHTHGEGQTQIRPNLMVFTGGTDYGYPRIERILEID
jgi:predicted phosphohydrolase